MRGRIPAIGSLVGAILALTASASAAVAAGPVAGAARVGSAPAGQRLVLDLPLKVDQAGLARFASAVSQPGSPEYGQYETVAQLAQRFGAGPSVRAHVLAYLRGIGAADVSIDPTGLFADATMSVGLAQRLFATPLSAFRSQTAAGVQRFVSPAAAVHIPAALAGDVTGVVGLDTQPLAPAAAAEPSSVERSSAERSSVEPSAAASTEGRTGSAYPGRSGTPSGCPQALAHRNGFTPSQYRTAYGISSGVFGSEGRGEKVALIEIDGFRRSDVVHFADCFALGPLARINVFGVGIRHALRPGGETTLDLELLDASAPGVFAPSHGGRQDRGVDVYESKPTAGSVLRALTAPLRNPRHHPDVISASLGACEQATAQALGRGGIGAVERSLQVAAADGISVLAAAGDDGSTSCLDHKGIPLRLKSVSFPASSPWVTSVGGTNLRLNAANQIASQVVWNDSPFQIGAGGGGYSGLFRRPRYQRRATRSRRRVVPDLAMLADPYPGYLIYCTAKPGCVTRSSRNPWVQYGGTSAGAPLLAGSFADIDAVLRGHRHPNLGFANPLIYRIARSRLGPAVFSDVTAGSNDVFKPFHRSVGCCSARRGFDAATGLGGVNVAALALATIAKTHGIGRITAKLPRQRHALRARRLRVRVSCSRACMFIAYTRISRAHVRGRLHAHTAIHRLAHRGHRTVSIRLSRKLRHRLVRALSHHHRVTAYVYAALVDPSEHVERHTHAKRLRIRR